eukprot:CAMPEP_0185026258 /NCGR_PEP_ID=MMETSP1103-20130426/10188_1 /TAXON_ID=36769 /ORGANISM="Paraphysomonas bandaiensis, Strain Caron Lab Isolate" /LENGTH=143 /DNA_ID=CAMNT_0027559769 /DNA_START=186 /DNA_END=614 /DNA_ORIENTATION=+
MKLNDVMFRRHFENVVISAEPVIPKPLINADIPFHKKLSPSIPVKNEAVIIVDTFSTGAMVAYKAFLKGYKVICVLSASLEGLLDMVPEGLNYSFSAVLSLNSTVDSTIAFTNLVSEIKALEWPIVAVIAGAETGVELADQLS